MQSFLTARISLSISARITVPNKRIPFLAKPCSEVSGQFDRRDISQGCLRWFLFGQNLCTFSILLSIIFHALMRLSKQKYLLYRLRRTLSLQATLDAQQSSSSRTIQCWSISTLLQTKWDVQIVACRLAFPGNPLTSAVIGRLWSKSPKQVGTKIRLHDGWISSHRERRWISVPESPSNTDDGTSAIVGKQSFGSLETYWLE